MTMLPPQLPLAKDGGGQLPPQPPWFQRLCAKCAVIIAKCAVINAKCAVKKFELQVIETKCILDTEN